MSARADIDWTFLRLAILIVMDRRRIGPVEAGRQIGINRTTFWRARHERPIIKAHVEKIARWIGWPPDRFERDWNARQLREAGEA